MVGSFVRGYVKAVVAVVAVIVFVVLLGSGRASASASWKRITIARHSGNVDATLSYEMRLDFEGAQYRRMTLVVHRSGALVIDWLFQAGDETRVALTLRDVWGDTEPEALVEIDSGGNTCCTQLSVGLLDGGRAGRMLMHSFALGGPNGGRHDGSYDFVSSDYNFYCAFTPCAGSSLPIQVFAIDNTGDRFVDVTRSRPDLVKSDAANLWREYQDGKGMPDRFDSVMGVLAPWCADQYLLGETSRCDEILHQAAAHGHLKGQLYGDVGTAKGSRAAIALLHKTLAAWGYDRG